MDKCFRDNRETIPSRCHVIRRNDQKIASLNVFNAIAEDGKYNYIRLTDNNFGQLMSAIADIRYGIINHDPVNHIYINETVGGIPSHRGSGSDYIIPHMMRNTFTGNELIFGNTAWDSLVSYDYETKTIPTIYPKDDEHLAPISFLHHKRLQYPNTQYQPWVNAMN